MLAVLSAYAPGRTRPPSRSGVLRNLRKRGERYYWHWDPAFLSHRQFDFGDMDVEAVLRQSGVPLMLVRGGRSDVVTDREAARFASAVPCAEIVELAGAAHMVAGDANDAFGAAILDFLGRMKPR